eukprot:1408800-Amphidinium_carterae.1
MAFLAIGALSIPCTACECMAVAFFPFRGCAHPPVISCRVCFALFCEQCMIWGVAGIGALLKLPMEWQAMATMISS